LVKVRFLLLSLALVLGIFAMANPATAGGLSVTCFPASPTNCLVSNSGNIEVVAGHSGSNTITLSAVGGYLEPSALVMFSGDLFSGPPPVGCKSVLPTGASCSFNPTQVPSVLPSTASVSSSLTITTSSTTPPGTYPVTVWVGYVSAGFIIIAPVFSIHQQQFHPEDGGFQVFTTQINLIVDPPLRQYYPVGGVMLPSVGFNALLPWALLLSLLGVVSVEALAAKRHAKRR
jgi:hypothetical protein